MVHVEAAVLLLEHFPHLDGLLVHVKGVELAMWPQCFEDLPGVSPSTKRSVDKHAIWVGMDPHLADNLGEHGGSVSAFELECALPNGFGHRY